MINLRPFKESDKPEVIRQLNNKNVSRFTSERVPFPYTEADGEKFFSYVRDPEGHHYFAITFNDQLIGGAGIHPQILNAAHVVEIGYWIGEEFWGKGYMSEAVRQLIEKSKEIKGVKKIMAKTSRENIASCKILEKFGFKIEGTLEKHFFKRGEYFDELVWGLMLK
jgi:ribosomal-protein-alanine N-acetyltransferase